MRIYTPLVAVALALPSIARAQRPADSLDLSGRSAITIGFGLTGSWTSTTSGGAEASTSSGQLGAIAFSHWMTPQVGIEIVAAVLNAEARTAPGSTAANAIMPILFGITIAPRALALGPTLRPYAGIAAGPYVHAVSDNSAQGTTDFTETAAGARVSVGANWFAARHFLIAVEGDYHVVGKFDHIDAVSEKPSGFGMMLTFGIPWGGR